MKVCYIGIFKEENQKIQLGGQNNYPKYNADKIANINELNSLLSGDMNTSGIIYQFTGELIGSQLISLTKIDEVIIKKDGDIRDSFCKVTRTKN